MSGTLATRLSKEFDRILTEHAAKRRAEQEAAEAKRQAEAKSEREAQVQQPAKKKEYSGGYGGRGDAYRKAEIERMIDG